MHLLVRSLFRWIQTLALFTIRVLVRALFATTVTTVVVTAAVVVLIIAVAIAFVVWTSTVAIAFWRIFMLLRI